MGRERLPAPQETGPRGQALPRRLQKTGPGLGARRASCSFTPGTLWGYPFSGMEASNGRRAVW